MPTRDKETFVLIETAAGFLLVHVKEWDVIAQENSNFQESLLDPSKFKLAVEVAAMQLFRNAEDALLNCQSVAAGECTDELRIFLEQNLPAKKKKYRLGVVDTVLGKSLSLLGFPVLCDKSIAELSRLCRMHINKLVKRFEKTSMIKFQVGLGHSYSRAKIKFDPQRQDKPIQNAVALLENLDKTINTFAMRVKEWYGWHFPELSRIVMDNVVFVKVAQLMRAKESFSDDRANELMEIIDDEAIVEEVMAARKISMGHELSEIDMINISRFAVEVEKLASQRKHLSEYLGTKLELVAPNLQCLVGDVLAAKLISHAGSLTTLSKYPASTVQILGAEKALFRALKSKGNTPKYGMLFQSSFIGKTAQKNKGRVSRYLANKCSMAARIDHFADVPSNIFGEKMKQQVEARLEYLKSGVLTKRNIDVMREAKMTFEEKVAASKKSA